MLLKSAESCLLVVDVQEKLIPAIHQHELLIKHCQWLMRVAQKMSVPVLISEQYPKGLGSTVPSLKAIFPHPSMIEKLHFSCTEDEHCARTIAETNRQQIVVIGIEAHVCVMQTAFGLLELDYDVFVIADCVSSRDPQDKTLALQRMQSAGIQILSREMVLFEWLHQSGTDLFRAMSKEFLRGV